MFSFRMNSPYHFANISVNISPNNKKKNDIFKIYAVRAVENVQNGFLNPKEAEKSTKKWVRAFLFTF